MVDPLGATKIQKILTLTKFERQKLIAAPKMSIFAYRLLNEVAPWWPNFATDPPGATKIQKY